MTAATLSRLPVSAGGALAGSLARGGLRVVAVLIDAGYWGIGRYMRAPVANSCIVAIVGFSVLAGSNALFMQTGRHPAPLFFSTPHSSAATRPVVPASRPRAQISAIDNETTGSVGPRAISAEAIGNGDVTAVQKKLAALKLFDGTVDGLFGRRTAAAIKAFEMKVGQKPRGKLTRELVDAVLAAPLPAAQALPTTQSLPAVQPLPAANPTVAEASPSQPAAMPVQPTKPLATVLAQSKPVPLAPLQHAAQQAADAAVQLASAATPPLAATGAAPSHRLVQVQQIAVPQPQQDTFAANSAPQATPDAAPLQVASLDPIEPAAPGTTVSAPAAAAPTATVAAPADVATPAAPAASATVMAMNNTAVASATLDPSATPAQRLAAQMGTLPPEATAASTAIPTSSDPGDGAGSTDPVLITKIQRGLASLGFLGAKIDGVPGEGTAKAIRNFEVFYDYRVTGLATPQLLDLLLQHGATI